MKAYWAYRLTFFGIVALAVGLVLLTVAGGRGTPVVAVPRASRGTAATTAPAPERALDRAPERESDGLVPVAGKVQITSVAPLRREVHLHNLGDGAEDLGGWRLIRPRPRAEETFTFPLGTVLLPGEEVIVVVGVGPDEPGVLYWPVPGERRLLDSAADAVALLDPEGTEVSRFAYTRR